MHSDYARYFIDWSMKMCLFVCFLLTFLIHFLPNALFPPAVMAVGVSVFHCYCFDQLCFPLSLLPVAQLLVQLVLAPVLVALLWMLALVVVDSPPYLLNYPFVERLCLYLTVVQRCDCAPDASLSDYAFVVNLNLTDKNKNHHIIDIPKSSST